MKTSMVQRLFSALVVGSALLCAVEPADAKEAAAIVEVAAPPPDFNTSTVALRTAAESELEHGSLPRGHRRVVISLALKQTGAAPIACSVNATVRDAKTGAMIAVVETATRATGPLSPALRKELADAAVRSAVRRVPGAIRAQK